MATVKELQEQFESFIDATITARSLSERDQAYNNHQQWTDAEVAVLDARNQAAVVINRVKVKVNLLKGIQRKTRTRPKALPRTPKHEGGADAATEALRFVTDNTDFQMISSAVFEDEVVPGYGAAIVEGADENGNININQIPWDRYYYDPHSRMLDFSDKKYDGIVLWMDEEDVKEQFPESADDIGLLFSAQFNESGTETFDDKPIWIDRQRKRIRILQHFYKEGGTWKMAFLTENLFLEDPVDSPFLDDNGNPSNPIEAQAVYIDNALDRYGEVRGYIWLQDEINHRRSRLLYAGSVNRTVGQKGAVDDVNTMKDELAKSNGHVETNKGFDFDIIPNDAISDTQLLLYRESKNELDETSASFGAGITGETSGRARQIQQQGTIAELASLYDGHKAWEKRIYRQIWNRVKQFWDAEKWIRVTDDKTNLDWVGLNTPVTNGEMLLRAANEGDQRAAQLLQQMMQAQDPRLNEVAEVENNVAEMDIDIILTESPDFVTIRQEQFEMLAALAERYGPENVPFTAILELSDMPNKDEVKKLLQTDVDPQQQAAQVELESQAAEQEMNKKQLENVKTQTEIEGQQITNVQKQVETMKLAQEPITSVNVNT